MIQKDSGDPKNVLLLVGSVLAVMISLIGAAGSILLGAVGFFIGGSASGPSGWVLAGTFVGLTVVSLPAGWVALRAMRGESLPISKPSNAQLLAILLSLLLVLAIGTVAFSGNILPSILGPPAHMLAALLPVLGLISIVLRRGPTISQRRGLGHFMAGLWLSPITALILELIAAIPIVLIIVIGLNASLGDDFLLRLWEQPDLFPDESSLDALLGVLSQPLNVVLLVSYLGILVPLIEEFIKSIGLLPLLRRQISEAEGFLGGVLAGAGYGLFEALYLGQPGPGWATLMLARAGATMMHMLTAGLTGLGFARAKKQGRIGPLLVFYLLAVGLHALWNFAAVLMGVGLAGEALKSTAISPAQGDILAVVGTLILVILSAGAFLGLRNLPEKLQQSEEPEVLQASVVESSSGL